MTIETLRSGLFDYSFVNDGLIVYNSKGKYIEEIV